LTISVQFTLIDRAIAFGTANVLFRFPCGTAKEGGTTATRENAEKLAFPGAMTDGTWTDLGHVQKCTVFLWVIK
jgi:hypothetical protein